MLNKTLKILSYLLIISILIMNIELYFTHNLNMAPFFESDALYLPALYRDIFLQGGSYTEWYLTPAAYFFPDMILYFFSNFVVDNFYYAIPLFFTLQSILILFLVYELYNLYLDKVTSLSWIAIVFSFLYLFPTPVYIYCMLSAYHYGEFIVGLFIIYLILIVINNEKIKAQYLLPILVFSALGIASDSLFMLHFILPSLLSIFVLWIIKSLKRKTLFVFVATFILSILLGRILHKLLIVNERERDTQLSMEHLHINLETIKNIFFDAFQNNTVSFIVVIIVLTVFLSIWLFRNKISGLSKKNKIPVSVEFISIFSIFAIIGLLIVLSFLNIGAQLRYMTPLFLLPIIFFPLIFIFVSQKKYTDSKKIGLFTATSFLLLITVYSSGNKLLYSEFKNSYYPNYIRCIDDFILETNSTNGIAQYWQSKQVYMLSKNSVIIAQVFPDLSPMTWITTNHWYKRKYDFALIDGSTHTSSNLLRQNIISLNGNPDKVYTCSNTEILYYKNKLYTKPFLESGTSMKWKASQLPSVIGKTRDSFIEAKKNIDNSGYITFGPYAKLPEGVYRFDISYSSSESNTTILGKWDIVVTLPKQLKRLAEGEIRGTGGKESHIIEDFDIPAEYTNQKVEIRNFYNATGDITIMHLTITRME